MENHNLYFIAIVLPNELSRKVIQVQNEIAERFESSKALKVLPHITLKAPFGLPAFAHNHVLDWFSELLIDIQPFQLELENFGAFKNLKHPVIFIKPGANEALSILQKIIIQEFYRTFDDVEMNGTELIFKPHITVAYRDLQPEMFNKAWPEFKNREFSGLLHVNSFQLLKHDGKSWHIIQRFDLK